MENSTTKERREFLRHPYNKPLTYKVISPTSKDNIASKLIAAISKNLSAAGILFITNVTKAPEIASILVLDLDYRTVNICHEIEQEALILDNKIIGKVVRIEDNEDNTCDIGVAFVRKSDPIINNIKELIK